MSVQGAGVDEPQASFQPHNSILEMASAKKCMMDLEETGEVCDGPWLLWVFILCFWAGS